ncbi:helix-turn-helix domain-containing protein [Actinophytocola xinjiangensis]|nr:helix-turn-helix domain-containing protein [Actinophytocola xinjiangensis]
MGRTVRFLIARDAVADRVTAPHSPSMIHTVRGAGYRLDPA